MKIAVIGTGYVGLPTGVGFAELGHDVVCIDKVSTKIDDLNQGKITLYEPDLEELFIKNRALERLQFTTSMAEGIQGANIIIIAVGTPTNPETKEADMRYIYAVAKELSALITGYTVIAIKSTVPIGTGAEVYSMIAQGAPNIEFDVVSLPEFLREGLAVEDFFHPDRIVIGVDNERAKSILLKLYADFEGKTEFLFVSRKSSELIKYAANSFLAIKVHYINEMADLCEKSGADIEEVAKGMGLDTRIGPKFLQPGPGYGGSCFPKDTVALASIGRKYGVQMHLVETAIAQNELRKKTMAQKILKALNNREQAIAILGLTFKAGTDDVRESPSVEICEELIKSSVSLRVYDPKGMGNAKECLGDKVYYGGNIYDACAGAALCVILTEWPEFKTIDWVHLKTVMCSHRILDLRNLLDKEQVEAVGFEYKRLGGIEC